MTQEDRFSPFCSSLRAGFPRWTAGIVLAIGAAWLLSGAPAAASHQNTIAAPDQGFTTDTGQTWSDVSGDLPDAPVNAVAVDNRYSPPALFVGTDVGAFISLDGGTRWLASGGLPNSPVTDLLLNIGDHQLVAGTYGRGIWAAPEHLFRRFRRPWFLAPPRPVFHGLHH